MKLTTGIVVVVITAGTVWGQSANVIDSTRDKLKAVQQKHGAEVKTAVAAHPQTVAAPSAAIKPAQGQPAGTPKPVIKASPASSPAVSTAPVVQKKTTPINPDKVSVENAKAFQPEAKKVEPKLIDLTGRRDPFVSPVVNRSMVGSGCSTGKRCLAIDQIALKGIVKSDNGMIAVVVNALEKAYFLRENDPVFNGYVVKITGDSIVFKETIQDKLGKSFTREVTKRISTPAV